MPISHEPRHGHEPCDSCAPGGSSLDRVLMSAGARLCAAPKGEVSGARPLTLEEDCLLRAAFGRYGGSLAARGAAQPVVQRYQQLGAGYWFLCPCRPGAQRPPALVPVAQTHIRRHQDARWPVHSEDCDFHREPAEQLVITMSYSAAAAVRPLRLARPLAALSFPLNRRFAASWYATKRPGLARLLMRLVIGAGFQRIDSGWRPPALVDQVKAIWAAARPIEIDIGVRLPEFLCTSPARLGELIERLGAAATWSRFVRNRPHGVLIARVAAIGDGVLEPAFGEPIPVRGRIAVFGERAGEARVESTARAPYLAACVVGQASYGEPAEVLSAYVHPIASSTHLMLVDSDLERQTLTQLRSLQAWLRRRQGMRVAIEKPLFDVTPEGDAPGNGAGAAARDPQPSRPPCIPDFIVRRCGGDGSEATAIVETMGFADEEYRARKARIFPMMRAALGGAPVVVHDFHEPAGRSQAWRDDRFWRALRGTLSPGETVGPARAGRPAQRTEMRERRSGEPPVVAEAPG